MAPRGTGSRDRDEYIRATERVLDKIMTCTQMGLPYGINSELEWQYLMEIHELAAELIDVQAKLGKPGTNKTRTPIATRLNKFKKWLHANGVPEDIPIDFVGNLAEGLGAIATRDIKPDEEIIRIPRRLCMSILSAQRSVRLRDVLTTMRNQLPASLLMILHLLEQRFTTNSFWKPYLDILPETYPLLPFFNPEDMAELKGTAVVRDCANTLKDMLRGYASAFRAVEKTGVISIWNYTFEQFRWATCTLFTRQNMIPGNCQYEVDLFAEEGIELTSAQLPEKMLALVPGWDLLNHKEGLPITSFNDNDQGTHTCAAAEPVKAGQQVYIGYTEERPNRHRFVRTGFLAPTAVDADTLHVSFKFPNLKDVARRRDLAYKLFRLSEPFPLDIQIPLVKNHDNVIGTLACAFGTAADLDFLAGLEELAEKEPREESAAKALRNMDAVVERYKAGELECTGKIVQYMDTQAMLHLTRGEDRVATVESELRELRAKKVSQVDQRDLFRINVLGFFLVEREYAAKIREYAQEEKAKLA
ncbi:hypothetical protein BCR44DRAFT_60646 [Catenaria anguillulae PL171]|uniref:protein-histidine N-methyltransferase n=1 Tax=Catenaria anguillulae PL171 TaxID=765915 RepID=A0A1Y2HXN7_9FUNG|nr:hypothetical protein BCR44DRAFT_60646 [Catenaria anguillulae PL171]